jgi:hypothetical protein
MECPKRRVFSNAGGGRKRGFWHSCLAATDFPETDFRPALPNSPSGPITLELPRDPPAIERIGVGSALQRSLSDSAILRQSRLVPDEKSARTSAPGAVP